MVQLCLDMSLWTRLHRGLHSDPDPPLIRKIEELFVFLFLRFEFTADVIKGSALKFLPSP